MTAELTQWLNRARAGDLDAGNAAFDLVYQQLKRLALAVLARNEHTFSATELVHEVYLRLVPAPSAASASVLTDRQHFFSLAGRAMRQILVDHARARSADKRGGQWQRTQLSEGLAADTGAGNIANSLDLVALDQALTRLQQRDPQLVQIVEAYFFAGLSFAEIALHQRTSDRSVRRLWETARLLLLADLRSS